MIAMLSLMHEQFVQGLEQDWLFDSPRVWGRGRTFVAAPDSDEASQFNPAALGQGDVTFQLRFLDANVMVGENTVSTIGDLMQAASTSNAFGLLQKFDQKFGEKQYAKLGGSILSLRFGGFEIFPFFVNESFMQFGNPSTPEVEWMVDTVTGVGFAYGMQLGKGISLGLSYRPLYRNHIAGRIEFLDIVEMLSPDTTQFQDFTPMTSGMGHGVDFGAIWSPKPEFRLGLTIRNLGDTAITGAEDKTPPAIRQNISLGMMARTVLWGFDLDYYLDLHSLMNRDGLSLLRLINTGVEFGKSLFTRDHDIGLTFGINEGYFTMGGFLDLYLFRLDLVNYGVEYGHNPGQKQDRRWGISLKSNMTF